MGKEIIWKRTIGEPQTAEKWAGEVEEWVEVKIDCKLKLLGKRSSHTWTQVIENHAYLSGAETSREIRNRIVNFLGILVSWRSMEERKD